MKRLRAENLSGKDSGNVIAYFFTDSDAINCGILTNIRTDGEIIHVTVMVRSPDRRSWGPHRATYSVPAKRNVRLWSPEEWSRKEMLKSMGEPYDENNE